MLLYVSAQTSGWARFFGQQLGEKDLRPGGASDKSEMLPTADPKVSIGLVETRWSLLHIAGRLGTVTKSKVRTSFCQMEHRLRDVGMMFITCGASVCVCVCLYMSMLVHPIAWLFFSRQHVCDDIICLW